MPSKSLFQITKQPFTSWADSIEDIASHLSEDLTDRLHEAMEEFAEGVREAILANPSWPDEAASAVEVREVGGEFELAIDHPLAEELELGGGPGTPPSSIVRVLGLNRERWFNDKLSAAVGASLGMDA